GKTKAYYKIKGFYDQLAAQKNELLEKLADIPFSFIINATPDKALSHIFESRNIRHHSLFFWKKKEPLAFVEQPSAQQPLIYNLLGSVERQESMVLTHTDLFEYLESVFSGNSFPERLKRSLKESNNFIFLGIPFERWYMQLLLRILYIHNDFDFVRYAANQAIDEEVRSFCFDQFRIEFVSTKIQAFVDELHQRCMHAGLYRKQQSEVESPVKRIYTLLEEDEFNEALLSLKDYLAQLGPSGEELIDDLVLLTSKYNRLSKRIIKGIISREEAELLSNKLRVELLELLKEAEKAW
ncbi:MAG: SIR2 family protein, partial [Phaeodactylibacter sp.]|nr:SIR2 family protein [Phaeodactylibacter sp.]